MIVAAIWIAFGAAIGFAVGFQFGKVSGLNWARRYYLSRFR